MIVFRLISFKCSMSSISPMSNKLEMFSYPGWNRKFRDFSTKTMHQRYNKNIRFVGLTKILHPAIFYITFGTLQIN